MLDHSVERDLLYDVIWDSPYYGFIETYKKITKALFIAGIIWASVVYISSFPIPRSAFPIYIILSIITVYYTRFTARNFLLSKQYIGAKNVLIYGIDSSSIQISEILRAKILNNFSSSIIIDEILSTCLLYTSPSPRDRG